MPDASFIPDSIESLDPAWLGERVSRRYPGAVAESIEVIDAHSGTTGRARLRVVWKAGTDAPATIFLKLAPTDPIQRQMVIATGMGRREARFYAEIAGELPIRAPAPIGSAWSDDASRYLMLLEDLAEVGCSFPSSKEPDGGKHATGMIDTLAGLHAHYWESPRFDADLSWVEPAMRHEIGPMLVDAAVKQVGDAMSPAFHELASLYREHNEALSDLLDAGPQTLVHGDSHLGNTFVDGDRVGLLDWACVCRAPGMRDVSYYLCASTATEDRRALETTLVRRYLDALARAGVDAPDFDEAWRQHRLFAVCSWIAAAATAGAGDRMQPIEIGMRALTRATTAIEDLETPALLREELGL